MLLHPPEWIREYRTAGYWSDDTWPALLTRWVHSKPHTVALVDPPNRDKIDGQPPQRYTWAQLDSEVHRVAGLLYEAGVRADDRIGIQLPNTADLVIALLAVTRLGAIASPFPVTYRRHEVIVLGRHAGLSGYLTTNRVEEHDLAEEVVD